MTRVAICIPSPETVCADFALCLAGLVRLSRVEGLFIVNERMSCIAEARNILVRQALSRGADWLMWLDADMMFPPQTLDRLLSHDQHIVGATYVRRVEPYPLIGTPQEGGVRKPGLTEMAAMPFGCMLVRRQVFEDTKAPWFRLDWDEDAKLHGEDILFCRAARAAGYTIFNDDGLTLTLGHVGRQVCRVNMPGAAREAA